MTGGDGFDSVLATLQALEHKLAVVRKRIYEEIRARELLVGQADLLSFRVGSLWCALPVARVHNVVQRCALVALPEAPAWVSGMLVLHGAMIPVLDLHYRLCGQRCAAALNDVLIVCGEGAQRVAILAAELGGVHFRAELADDPDLHGVAHGPYVMAVARVGDVSMLVLSLASLLYGAELHSEVAA